MAMSNPRPAGVSIDFGTSHTVASIRRADGRVHQQLFDGSPQLPSAVFMNDEGGPVVGADALHGGRRKPERFEPNPKRRIDDATILLGETELPVTSVIAAVLSRVARDCQQTLGDLGQVTVTVPAAWGPTRRHIVADAATAAGLGKVDLIAEPVAAASYFVETLQHDVPIGSGVVVYDLGGGTFDATVLRRSAGGFDILAVDGALDLGGLDFDQALAQHLAASVQPDDERWTRIMSPTENADLRYRATFMEEVRQAKERLSRSVSTDLTIPLIDVDAHLTREELESVCAPLVERTVRVAQGVIRESGLANEQIAGLFLVGAASRMPLVATRLHQELGIAPAAIEQPELAVSEGGLVTREIISTSPAPTPSPALPPQVTGPQVTPQPSPMPQMQSPMPVQQGHMTGPITQPSMQTGPIPAQQSRSWLTSTAGITTLIASALAIVLIAGLFIVPGILKDQGELNAGNDDTSNAADNEESSGEEASGDSGGSSGESDPGEGSGLVDIADAQLGDQIAEMTDPHVGAVTRVRTAEVDGETVAVTGGVDGIIRIWDPATGELIDTYRGHTDEIEGMSIVDVDGRPVVWSKDYSTESVWYLDDPSEVIDSRESNYNGVAWVGMWGSVPAYASGNEIMQLFTGDEIDTIQSTYYPDWWTLEEVDGKMREVGVSENRVYVSDMETGESAGGTFDQLAYDVAAFDVGQAGDTALAVTATSEGSVQAWDLASAEKYGTAATELYQTVYDMEVTQLNDRPVVLVWGSTGLSLFDLDTGEQIGESLAPHSGDDELYYAAIANVDGHPVAVTGSGLGTVQTWSLQE
ncbi:Hsp70 family protein [Glycomyces buryatensis]|nr:Hsp70 family protein [Glycomyces buryatensis]